MILESQRPTNFFFPVNLIWGDQRFPRKRSFALEWEESFQELFKPEWLFGSSGSGLMDKVLVATLLAKVWTEQQPNVTPSTQVLGEIISQISKLKSIKNYIQLPQQVWGSGMATFFKESPQAAGHFGFRSFVILRISFLLLLRLRPLGYWVGNFCLAGYKRRYL